MKDPKATPVQTEQTQAAAPAGGGTEGQWLYRQVQKSRILAQGIFATVRTTIYGLRPMLGLVLGATTADIKAAGALFTQVTEVRFDALETVKAEAPDLIPSSTMSADEIRARRQNLEGVETVETGMGAVMVDVTGTRILRNKELVDEYDTAKADLDARRAQTVATGNPDQRILQYSDIMNNAARVAVDRAMQGKKDKATAMDQGGQKQAELEQQLATANQMIATLRDELAQLRQQLLTGQGGGDTTKPAPRTQKGNAAAPAGRRGQKR